jgi:hypothetical protein
LTKSLQGRLNSLIIAFYKIPPKLDVLIISALGVVNAFCLSPSITDSLGTTSLDDSPVQPALGIKYPQYFENDFLTKRYTVLMWTSSTKWIPALLYKYLSVDPVFFHVLFTYLQTILILVGTFLLAKALTNSRSISFVSVFFVINLAPYFDNIAWYGDEFFMPYPTWCSIGPLLIAWSYALKGKTRRQFIWLAIGCSIHPAMGLCGSILVLVTTHKDQLLDFAKLTKHLLFALAPASLFSFISWFISKSYSAPSAPSGWSESTKEVTHWYAWQLIPNTDESLFQQTSFTIILALTGYVLLYSPLLKHVEKLRTVVRNALLIFLLFYSIQAISYTVSIRSIYSLSLGRISIFTSILAVIILAKYLMEIQKSAQIDISIKERIFLTIALIIPSFFNLLLVGLFLFWKVLKKKRKDKRLLSIFGIYSILILVFWLSNFSKSWIGMPPWSRLFESTYLVPNFFLIKVAEYFLGTYLIFAYVCAILILSLVIAYFTKFESKIGIGFVLIGLMITLALGSFTSRYVQSEDRAAKDREWINAQTWVRDETPFGSKFIVNSKFDTYSSWTTLTKRARIQTADDGAGFLYIYSKDDAAFDKLRSKLPDAPSDHAGIEITESFYSDFSLTIGGDYIVRRNSDTPLTWQVAYRNTEFVIYKIPGIGGS